MANLRELSIIEKRGFKTQIVFPKIPYYWRNILKSVCSRHHRNPISNTPTHPPKSFWEIGAWKFSNIILLTAIHMIQGPFMTLIWFICWRCVWYYHVCWLFPTCTWPGLWPDILATCSSELSELQNTFNVSFYTT